MKILLLSSTYDSLTQRLHVELAGRGHEVAFDIASNDLQTAETVQQHKPELIFCPFLESSLSRAIWHRNRCISLHIHTDIDKGPSALDWAIQEQENHCVISAIQISSEMDVGLLWASQTFPLRSVAKSNIYMLELQDAAVKVALETITHAQNINFIPQSLHYTHTDVREQSRPGMTQNDRSIDWEEDSTATILSKIYAADGYPGVADNIRGIDYYIYGATYEDTLRGSPKALIAKRHGAVCRATRDGALWLSHLELKTDEPERKNFKLPAATVFRSKIKDLPEVSISMHEPVRDTYREIWYEEHNQVGYLYFDFYEGAMGTEQCLRLRDAVVEALKQPTRVLVLSGGKAFWSHGIDLRVIEASENPAEESWHNINALNDLILAIMTATEKITIAAVHGGVSAGGIGLVAAFDKVCARDGVLFNFNYKSMGLFGSEYWTYNLPRRIGYDKALELIDNCRMLSAREAKQIGLIDVALAKMLGDFDQKIKVMAEALAQHVNYDAILRAKIHRRNQDEFFKPLQYYREEEQNRMKGEFFESEAFFHLIRKQLVYTKNPPVKDTW